MTNNLNTELNWYKEIPKDISKITYYNNFCNILLSYDPIEIIGSVELCPIVVFSNKWKQGSSIPLTGDYKYGTLDGIEITITNNLTNKVKIITPVKDIIYNII